MPGRLNRERDEADSIYECCRLQDSFSNTVPSLTLFILFRPQKQHYHGGEERRQGCVGELLRSTSSPTFSCDDKEGEITSNQPTRETYTSARATRIGLNRMRAIMLTRGSLGLYSVHPASTNWVNSATLYVPSLGTLTRTGE